MLSWSLLYYSSEWAIRLVMLVYVPQKRSAAAARGWLLFIFLLPWPGIIVYSLIGRPYLTRRRMALQARISQIIREEQAQRGRPDIKSTVDLPAEFSHVVRLAQNLGDFQIFPGNAIELLDDYDGTIDRIVGDIDAAAHHVHLLYYIFADDRTGNRVADALAGAVSRGVSCRVLMDGTGSRSGLGRLAGKLQKAGVEVVTLLPARWWRRFTSGRIDLRNHRKIVVVDGRVGFVGSQNLINADFKQPLVNEEVVVRVMGPVVAELQAVFLADRLVETEQQIRHPLMFPDVPAAGMCAAQVLPSGPGYPHENNQRFIVALIHAATRRVVITSPYFIPDDPFIQAMTTAVLRGVEVHLVVSQQIDQYLVGLGQRSFYDELLEGGVRIHSYVKRFLHAKHVSIDDSIALIGSSNMDIRSFMLNAEVMLVVYDRGVVAELRRIQERYFAGSVEVTREAWRGRPKVYRVLENTARLADSLL
ncbi:MAG: cls [Phycisphaerales bacterium]|nr:cls [Phycisphaerales bacterium]